jgi:hypothetical protein
MFGEIKNHEDPKLVLLVSNQMFEKQAREIQENLQNYYLCINRQVVIKKYGTEINRDGKTYRTIKGFFSVWISK